MPEINTLRLPKWFIIITLILVLDMLHVKINVPLPGWYMIACGMLLYKFVINKKNNLLRCFIILTLVVIYGFMHTKINMILPEWYMILVFVVLYGLVSDTKSDKSNAVTTTDKMNVPN